MTKTAAGPETAPQSENKNGPEGRLYLDKGY